jgi:hypothetical protein
MSNAKRKRLDFVFPHRADNAHKRLLHLEELVAPIVARRTTTAFKQRLQRSIARLGDVLVEYSICEPIEREDLITEALRACRKAVGSLELLYRGGVVDRDQYLAMFDLLVAITRLLLERTCALLDIQLPRPTVDMTLENEWQPEANGAEPRRAAEQEQPGAAMSS